MKPIPKLGSITKLKGLKDIKAMPRRAPALRPIVKDPEVPGEREDPLEKAAMQGTEGTLPERIVWKWLESRNALYQVQVSEYGGRGQLGGMSLDFVVWGLAGLPVALRVQGEYWHGPHSDRQAVDDEQAGRLRADGYLVVDLWEQDIYQAVIGHRLTEYIYQQIL